MPWVRFDDQFPIHRKVAGLSDAAFRLHTEAIFWCARNLTDGFIGTSELHLIGAETGSKKGKNLKLTHEYLALGLWHDADAKCASAKCPAPVDTGRAGWVIHDYWEYQPSSEQVQRERAAKAARQQRWLEGKKRRVSDVSVDASQDASSDVSGDAAPPRTRPYLGVDAVTDPARGRHSRPVETPSRFTNSRPGDGAAARSPSARPLAEALEAAGINGQPPARGDTVRNIATEARRALDAARDRTQEDTA